MMKKLMYPHGKEAIFCCGKGGNMGEQFMMETAIELLKRQARLRPPQSHQTRPEGVPCPSPPVPKLALRPWQGHSGERKSILMVGDRFDTDIRAGLSVGIKTCLVTSGCHSLECQQFYRMDPAHFYAPCVMHLTTSNTTKLNAVVSPPRAERTELLREWMMARGNVLRPSCEDTGSEEGLRSRLRDYFQMADLDGDGSIDATELLASLAQLGLSTARVGEFARDLPPSATQQKLHRMLGLNVTDTATLRLAPHVIAAAQHAPAAAELALGFDEFVVVIEGVLHFSGVIMRSKWRKASTASRLFGLEPTSTSMGANAVAETEAAA